MKRLTLFLILTLALAAFASFSTSAPAAAQTVTNAYGIVTAYRLNVRDYPDPTYGSVIARISRDEFYLVTAKSSFNNWWLILLADGRQGWVSGGYFRVFDGYLAPVITPALPVGGTPSQPTTPAPTGATGTVTTGALNVRTAPNPVTGQVIARLYNGDVVAVVGRTASYSWWQVRLGDGRVGWVSDRYLAVVNYALVPITG
ncbi:MAG: SH3 domain-containing protein [bacterium]|nr:SH3 domain-containing protein [bacterium]